jgi:hypothetical protein
MPINSRSKGARGEIEWRNFLRDRGYEDARRTQQYCGNTGDASDVVCSGLSGYHQEVKRTEKLNVYTALKQAIRDASEGKVPFVAHRRSNEDWLIILKASDFMDLVEKADGHSR